MKKLFLLVAVVTLCFAMAVSANALTETGQCGDNVYWKFNSETGELVISGEGSMWDYKYGYYSDSLPSYKKNLYDKNITSVRIENGVTGIGDYAFYFCQNLTSVTMPDSLTSIGTLAFCNCDSLTSITIPDNVTSIGLSAFKQCYNIENITISSKAININIGDAAFADTSIKSITLPESVASLGNLVFSNCKDLESISIPKGVKNIGAGLFERCDNLVSVIIPDSVTVIGDNAFSYCKNLENITIPDSVTGIGNSAFSHCENLSIVTIPDRVTRIGDYAFSNCTSLSSVTIGNRVSDIGIECFSCCSNLVSVNADKNNTYYSSSEGVLFNKDKTLLLYYPIGKTNTYYSIPEGVITIGREAFLLADNLKEVTISNTVTTIGLQAFCESGLERVVIPDSVITLEERAFAYCWELSDVMLGKNVEKIGVYAFLCCPITELKLPDSVINIEDLAFEYTPLIYMEIPKGIRELDTGIFFGCEDLEYLIIPTSVKIMDNAFHQCYKLKDIYYYGTEEEWNKIQKNSSYGDCKISEMTIHFNYNGSNIGGDAGDNTSSDNSNTITPEEPDITDCSCNCHKSGFMGFIWKIVLFFNKLFKTNRTCICGIAHY